MTNADRKTLSTLEKADAIATIASANRIREINTSNLRSSGMNGECMKPGTVGQSKTGEQHIIKEE